jgi:CHAT domain-containing protein
MAALYDGKQYLLEKYSVAIAPGLQLLKPQTLAPQKLQAIAASVSQSNQGYQALPGVENELAKIDAQINTQVLLNQNFTQSNLQNTVDNHRFSILHLATHGKFSSNAKDTYILTWNGKINVKEFDTLIRSRGTDRSNRIELLVLSACQTAKGDPKATLGLAGLAVRSGASSTLGTLWAVRDRPTTKLITEFYQYLGQPDITRAEALRRAQLSLLQGEYSHPVYWAAFVLVGNWS